MADPSFVTDADRRIPPAQRAAIVQREAAMFFAVRGSAATFTDGASQLTGERALLAARVDDGESQFELHSSQGPSADNVWDTQVLNTLADSQRPHPPPPPPQQQQQQPSAAEQPLLHLSDNVPSAAQPAQPQRPSQAPLMSSRSASIIAQILAPLSPSLPSGAASHERSQEDSQALGPATQMPLRSPSSPLRPPTAQPSSPARPSTSPLATPSQSPARTSASQTRMPSLHSHTPSSPHPSQSSSHPPSPLRNVVSSQTTLPMRSSQPTSQPGQPQSALSSPLKPSASPAKRAQPDEPPPSHNEHDDDDDNNDAPAPLGPREPDQPPIDAFLQRVPRSPVRDDNASPLRRQASQRLQALATREHSQDLFDEYPPERPSHSSQSSQPVIALETTPASQPPHQDQLEVAETPSKSSSVTSPVSAHRLVTKKKRVVHEQAEQPEQPIARKRARAPSPEHANFTPSPESKRPRPQSLPGPAAAQHAPAPPPAPSSAPRRPRITDWNDLRLPIKVKPIVVDPSNW